MISLQEAKPGAVGGGYGRLTPPCSSLCSIAAPGAELISSNRGGKFKEGSLFESPKDVVAISTLREIP